MRGEKDEVMREEKLGEGRRKKLLEEEAEAV